MSFKHGNDFEVTSVTIRSPTKPSWENTWMWSMVMTLTIIVVNSATIRPLTKLSWENIWISSISRKWVMKDFAATYVMKFYIRKRTTCREIIKSVSGVWWTVRENKLNIKNHTRYDHENQKSALTLSGTCANSLIMCFGKFTKQHKQQVKESSLKVSNVMFLEKITKIKTAWYSTGRYITQNQLEIVWNTLKEAMDFLYYGFPQLACQAWFRTTIRRGL